MLPSIAALTCALLLGQEGGETMPPAPAPPLQAEADQTAPAPLPQTGGEPTTAAPRPQKSAAPVLPTQKWEGIHYCVDLPPTEQIPSGHYAAECDSAKHECRVAPLNELDASGTETDRPLERSQGCVVSQSLLDTLGEYRLLPATASAPPGWYRDEQGRVMQFNFDLHRRIWLGGAWAPRWVEGGAGKDNRVRADFGMDFEWPQGPSRLHRLTLFDTAVYLGDDSALDATMLRYEFRTEEHEPLVRVTTFLGEPARHDIFLNLGVWTEAMHLEKVRRDGARADFLALSTVHASLDLWHSRDLVSYVRVRAGPSVERDLTGRQLTLVPGAALEGDLTLDRDGFHHLRVDAEVEKVLLSKTVAGRVARPERLRLHAGYEAILLAINDQPVSLVLDGRGTWRDDLAHVPATWEWSAQAGLRFSLWAPVRRSAPLAGNGKG
ncbi:hypothetical protein DRW03_03940 [Corallococcus sp. H22C18031201]|nr:hypothetical protein DRW03_03940 [Corallococcus sp. H22C18031201]